MGTNTPAEDALQAENRQLRERIAVLENERQALREREEHFRTLSETMLQGVVYQASDGKILSMNPAAERILGKSPADFLGTTSVNQERDSIREDGSPFPGLEHPAMVALATGREVRNVRMGVFNPREEDYRWIDVTAVPLFRSGETKPHQVYTVFEDVTDRKTAEVALRESEARLRRIARAGPIGLFEWNAAKDIAYWSPEHYELFGYEPGTPVSWQRWLERVHPEDRHRVAENSARLLDRARLEGQVRGHKDEYRCIRADGSVAWLESDISVDMAGGEAIIRGAVRDISERKQAGEALRASEERLRLALQAAKAGAWEWDLRTGENRWSEELWSLYGMAPYSCTPSYDAWLATIHPDDREGVVRAVQTAAAMGAELDVEWRVHSSENPTRWLLSRGQPQRDAGGHVVRYLGIVLDITDRKSVEEALRESEARFRLALKNAPVSVAAQDRDLRYIWAYNQRSASPGQIVGHFDHEIFTAQEAAHVTPVKRRVLEEGVEHRERMWLDRPTGRLYLDICWEPIRDPAGRIVGVASASVDLTPLKLAEEALWRSEARWNAAIESFAEGAIIATEDEQVIYWNPAARAMHGFTRPDEGIESLENTVVTFQLWLPDGSRMLELDEWPMRRIKRGETVRNLELRIRRPGQGWEKVFSYSGAMVDTAGGERLIFLTCHDLTELRKAEQALRENEERLRLAQDAAAIGSFAWNVQTGLNTWTAKLEEMHGLPVGSFGRTQTAWEDLVHPEDRGRARERVQESLESGAPTEGEWRVIWPDGSVHWLSGRWQVFKDANGTPLRMTGVNIDITERKHAEEALRESDRRFRSLFENSTDAIFLTSVDGRIFAANPAARAMFGMSDREICEKGREGLIASGEPRLGPALEKRKDEGRVHAEFTFVRKDGSRFEGDVTSVVLDEAGDAFVAVRDVTERKMEEERLRQAQKLESLGLLAGGVAHDFNNLLVGVIGNASLAQELLSPDHPAADLIEGVLKSGEQAAHLTRQMLAYSGKGRFLMEQLNLSAIVPEMVGLVLPSISKKIALHMSLDEALPSIEADRGQVQQVFMNLALNAAEAIGSRDGAIAVRTSVQVVDDAFRRLNPEAEGLPPGEYVLLEVRDTGCGMDEKTKARIFDPFFSTKFIGRGLGLAAVAGIVRGHKGAIIVRSAPGRGTAFTVLLPAAKKPAEQTRAAAPGAGLRGSGIVLVVDDEEVVRETAKKALERLGYTVLVADSGLAAVDMFRRHPADIAVVLLDLSMPHMNGEETLPELRKIRPEARVIISSGYSEAETMALFRGQQVSGFIQKPYTSTGLGEKVKLALL
jgi:two-component system, cell cycle sensor histidine kinase and response regulator CckA